MREVDETAIAEGLARQRSEAWVALYEAYAERVWRCTARLIGAREADIADVVQETFLEAARSARGYKAEKGTLWVWLWGICRNQALLYHRKNKRQPDTMDARAQGVLQQLASMEEEPLASMEAHEMAGLVRGALLELPEDYSLLLVAKYLEGQSVEVIARQTGMSASAVMSKLARARQALRERLIATGEVMGKQPGKAER